MEKAERKKATTDRTAVNYKPQTVRADTGSPTFPS